MPEHLTAETEQRALAARTMGDYAAAGRELAAAGAGAGIRQLPGATVDEGAGRKFPCASCGADLVFHIGRQKLKCEYCGSERDLELEHAEQVSERKLLDGLQKQAALRQEGARQEIRSVRCDSCGGEVEFFGNLASMNCCFCGSPIQEELIAPVRDDRLPIDAVLPFYCDRDSARENINRWIRSLWWAPGTFLSLKVEEKLIGVYMPFWTYDSMTYTVYTGQRGEHHWVTTGTGKNRRRTRETRWYPASGQFARFFDDVLVLACDSLPEGVVQRLEPWPLEQCLPFNQQVLAGYVVNKYTTELEPGFRKAADRIQEELREDAKRRIGGDEQRIHSLDVSHDACTYKHVLLPVWKVIVPFRGKLYEVIVNATTGEVQGERPYSVFKIALAVLIAVIVVATIGLMLSRH